MESNKWLARWETAADLAEDTGDADEADLIEHELHDTAGEPDLESFPGKALFLMPDGSVVSADDDNGHFDGWDAHPDMETALRDLVSE